MPRLTPLSSEESRARRKEVARKAAAGELRFPEAFREMRLALGMTQERFGEVFGMSRLRVIALEAGRGNPTLDVLNRIGKPFGFQAGFVPKEKK